MASLNVLIKLLPSSPFPLFLHRRSPVPFCLLFLFPFSSISWAMLAVSISFCNLDFVGCHVFDIRSGHIYFQRQYFLYFIPFCFKYFLYELHTLLWLYLFSMLSLLLFFCSHSLNFSLTRESNSLSDYRRVRMPSLEPRLFLYCPHSTTLSFRLKFLVSAFPSAGSREWYVCWLPFLSHLIERL